MPSIEFDGEKIVTFDRSSCSVLDLSLANGIPHVHACGGQGRCSTCRVIVLDSGAGLGSRTEAESELATRKGLPECVRLACQAVPVGDVKLRRLVRDPMDQELAEKTGSVEPARELELAILFSDLRGFTPMVERHLAYDVVHMLDRHFQLAGQAVLDAGGFIDKYIGDSIMALFGLSDSSPAESCGAAIAAARAMVRSLDPLNSYLEDQFGEVLRCGVGIHFGRVVVGEVGHLERRQFTAIGDAVNVAARIESMTKTAGADILVSEDVRRRAPELVAETDRFSTELKGKSESFDLYRVRLA